MLTLNSPNEQWTSFQSNFEKHYENGLKESFRFKIFIDNLQKINDHNDKFKKGLSTNKLGINQFGDLLEHEFEQKMSGLKKNYNPQHPNQIYVSPVNREFDSEVDWRAKGAVTSVKDQKDCNSSWAFSAAGSIEGQHYIKHGKLLNLSAQNVIDCDPISQGCKGGFVEVALTVITLIGGIDTEEFYPYKGVQQNCLYDSDHIGSQISGYYKINNGNEDDLKAAVADIGPSSVVVNNKFHLYKSGVFDDPTCTADDISYGMLVVGYGITEKKQEYWIVKSSLGEEWGEKGYILMSRNKNNQCGIASSASYPYII